MNCARAEVHTSSGHRLGASHPRQEAPPDLRLVPPAVCAWGAAALAPSATGRQVAVAVLLCLLLASLLLLAGRAGRGPGRTLRSTAVLALLCATAAAVAAALHTASVNSGPLPGLAEEHGSAAVAVEVADDPERLAARPGAPPLLMFRATAESVRRPGGGAAEVSSPVLVLVAAEEPGDWLRLLPSTRLMLPDAEVQPPLGGRGSGLSAVLRVRGGEPPQLVAGAGPAQRLAGRLRADLRTATDGLPPDARALLPALVVGDTSRLTPQLEEAVRATDMSHLIVVSGAHLGIVLAVLIGGPGTAARAERGGVAARLGVPLRTTAVLGGALVLAFVVLCRPGPSVLRAAVCGGIALLALATGRHRSLLPALSAATLLLVLHDPTLARSYGFLLSVLATGALLTLAPAWSRGLRRRGMPSRPAEALAAAGAAQVVCAPVVAVFAMQVSLVAVPCNLLAQLAFAPATVLGWAALVTAPLLMPLAVLLSRLAGWPAGWIAAIARTGADLPGARIDWPGGWTGAALLALSTLAVLGLLRHALRHVWTALGCALLLVVILLRPAPVERVITGWPPPAWRVVACDVGQGDGLVVAAGEGTALVVDTGPDPGAMDRCLRGLAVHRVPLVVLSHFHADHVAGLPGVLDGRSVGAVQTTTVREPAEQAAFVDRVADGAGVPVLRAVPGERRRLGPALDWQVLWPPEDTAGQSSNDSSVTLLLRVAGISVLLPGDLEPGAQRALLVRHPELGPVDVLKVAHHGSGYQHPELLERLSPDVALISVGAGNSYGHPSPRTVAALRATGATVLRTDTEGEVAVTGDARGLRVVRAGRSARRGRRRRLRGDAPAGSTGGIFLVCPHRGNRSTIRTPDPSRTRSRTAGPPPRTVGRPPGTARRGRRTPGRVCRRPARTRGPPVPGGRRAGGCRGGHGVSAAPSSPPRSGPRP